MSRSAYQRQQQKLQLQQQLLAQQQMAENEAAAAAAELFDLFCVATTMRQILGLHRNMCELIGLRPSPLNDFYPKVKAKVRSWKAQALWKKFDARASQRVYAKGNACTGTRVLVIGAGPCGLRTAIEAQLLGAKVVVVEKRDRISRNNVLHLWPFVITDLRNLGAKKFYGKFCAGSIDHISIRQLQCILLKVALLLGVEIHEGVSFERTIEPTGDGCGWRAALSPIDHAVSHYEFDILIGADGKRNTLESFKRKEFRGKLAIAITANFINKKTEAEAKVEEISGVAFIFNQSFFKELYHTTGIDLENIVYYKDETHYFVMTAKKHSLIDKGVILQDFADPAELLAPANVNTEKLLDYAREAAEFSTKYQMPNLEFAVNHYGKPDVAMFDFTSMFAAESSCRVIVRKGFRLLQCLVGDSLLEPFWPTGSGCARGFLSSMDSAYAIKLWSNSFNSILGVVAQRESIYRLLNQTTPENLQRDIGSYTVDPATRYPNLNRTSVNVWQIKHLVDTDDQQILEQTYMDTNTLQITQVDTPVKRKRRSGDSVPLSSILLRWVCAQLHSYEFAKELKEASDIFTNGKVLCALINRYRPDLVDMNAVKDLSPVESNDLAFRILEKEMHIQRIMNGRDSLQLQSIESKIWLNYLEQICEVFRGEIPHIKHPKIDFTELREKYRLNNAHAQPDFSKLLQLSTKPPKSRSPLHDMVDVPHIVQRRSVLDEEKLKRQRKHEQLMANNNAGNATGTGQAPTDTPRRAKKRRNNTDKAANIDRERGDIPSALPRGNVDEQFSDRIRSMEQRITSRSGCGPEKKPKDLMRAIGKIDSSDWQIREIEKKIEQSKKTEVHGPKGREKVPKWSKEQFQARQNKMAKPNRQDSAEEKFKEIDQTLKNLDKQLKEGSVLEVGERGRNKVASIAGQFVKREDTSEEKNPPTVVAKPTAKVALAFKKQSASEKCHFCKQTVYLMEKLHTEGLIMHRACLKCHHCHSNLRLGAYAFDRDDPSGRFYCTQHFRLPAKAIRPVMRKQGQKKNAQQQAAAKPQEDSPITSLDSIKAIVSASGDSEIKRGLVDSVTQMELLDRGQTPERIEFANTDNMSDGEPSEEHIIDEHEWSGRNFLPESNNDSGSDLTSSDETDTESDSEMYEEANDSPLGAQTLQLASDWIGKQNYTETDDSDDFYDSSEGIADDGKDDTEGEEFQKARELRREEVRLQPLPPNLPTDTETEVQTETESTSPDEVELNSATEISTDSEFDHDEIIRETPKIFIDDTHLRKPTKVQIKSSILPPTAASHKINSHPDNAQSKGGSYLAKYQSPPLPQFKPLVQVDPSLLIASTKRTPLQNPRPGDYLLNKTASTEGIASKKSLELKKRYLLGEPSNGNKIQKSGSTSVLDSRIRSFQSNISECQKLLNPGSDISPAMKTFLDRTKLGEKPNQEMLPSAPNNILNDLRVEITIQKASSAASTDNEKENVFVTSKNELNKGMEYSETVNTALMESMGKNKTPTTPTNKIIETIDLVTPEKENKFIQDNDNTKIIDLTSETPEKLSNAAGSPDKNLMNFLTSVVDSNKTVELTKDSLVKDNRTVIAEPDISKDAKHCIPDILDHIETQEVSVSHSEENVGLLKNCGSNDEKADYPEKVESSPNGNDVCDVQIEVPTIPWSKLKAGHISSTTGSSCSSHSSSVEDIEHYILESTTSPDTLNSAAVPNNHQVPRLEVHDSSGTLMQIDSLMIIDGKYIGDPDDLKYMEIPDGLIIPPQPPEVKTSVLEDQTELDTEPVTATPEPIECTIIDIRKELSNDLQALPAQGSSEAIDKGIPLKQKRYDLKFDTKNENKVESLKNLPLIVDQIVLEHAKAVKPVSLNLSTAQSKTVETPTTPLAIDMDKTPTADIQSRGSDSETEPTGTGQILTETELSDWTADDCISENFVDIEFVLNSNKGTIKRNKDNKINKKKHDSAKLPSTSEVMQEVAKVAPVAEFEGILKSIDLDDIEFMDTGSDGSCGESPYSATNATMLLNRGYVEFVDRTIPPPVLRENKFDTFQPLIAKRDEKLGIDYIEQGAYIMQDDINKTPVNEIPHESSKVLKTTSLMTQSLTDSSTVNDMDEDSTCALTVQLSSVTTGTGTESSITAISQKSTSQQESEALTVVTSPFDSPSPKTQAGQGSETADASTPSSSERLPKTSLSTGSPSSISCSKVTPPRADGTPARRSTEEISYEEYVRALQQKIAQISTARADSLDARKQRRKSSKGEVPATNIAVNNSSPTVSTVSASNINTQTVIDLATTTTTPCNLKLSNNDVVENATRISAVDAIETTNATKTSQVNKVPEIPTLTRKLEEITKERTKQKDLIHDLVMDKLQSKKQLNAEKRLNRSRQRSMPISPGNRGYASGYASGSSLSPTPKLAAASNTADSNCTNQAHYHVSTAVAEVPPIDAHPPVRLFNSISFKENKSPSYTSPYGKVDALSPIRSNVYKPRPLSETFDSGQLSTRCKLAKTPTFSQPRRPLTDDVNKCSQIPADSKTTPSPPIRQNRGREAVSPATTHSANLTDPNFSISTENLRNEARARARLKSNTELGLSPEEKMLLLRKRLQADYPKTNKEVAKSEKINTSKSVNDLASYGHNRQARKTPIEEKSADFTSDPNLLLSSSPKPIKNKLGARVKDPERRKSLIQSLSNFFHKASTSNQQSREKKQEVVANVTASEGNSAPSERPSTGGSSSTSTSQTISGSIDGVLSRFRISPRSKEKSKSCFDLRNFGFGDKEDHLIVGKKSSTASLNNAGRFRTSSATLDYPRNTHSMHTSYSHSQSNNNLNINCNCKSSNSSIHNNHNQQQQQQQQKHQQQQQQLHDNHSHHEHKQQPKQSHNHHHHFSRHQEQMSPHGGLYTKSQKRSASSTALAFSSSSPQLYCVNKSNSLTNTNVATSCDEQTPPPIPPLPINYQRSDDESYTNETREQKKQRAVSKATRQAELKRLRIAQEIQREQEEIEVQLKELERRGVVIEKALRGEAQNFDNIYPSHSIGNDDEKLLKELLEIWRNITQLKKRDEELSIRQQELQLEHRHAQLKEELNLRLSCNKLDKSSADVAAEGAILNEMLEIVAKRAALRPSTSAVDLLSASERLRSQEMETVANQIQLTPTHELIPDNDESNI
ncbi:molecule interacting with CasL isoform 3-T7 [Glossina fuscipes fuscipes]